MSFTMRNNKGRQDVGIVLNRPNLEHLMEMGGAMHKISLDRHGIEGVDLLIIGAETEAEIRDRLVSLVEEIGGEVGQEGIPDENL